jgi:hypothetical protein
LRIGYQGEIKYYISNIKHLVHGELVGVGSLWLYIGILHHSVLGEKEVAFLIRHFAGGLGGKEGATLQFV